MKDKAIKILMACLMLFACAKKDPVKVTKSVEKLMNTESIIIELEGFQDGTWISEHDLAFQFQVKDSKVRIINNPSTIDIPNFSPFMIKKGTSSFADSRNNTGDFLVVMHQNDTLRYEILLKEDNGEDFLLVDGTILYTFKFKK